MKNILKYFGYIHQSEITPEFLYTETGKLLGNPRDIPELAKLEETFMNDLSQVDNVDMFLDLTMLADMRREFSSQDDVSRNIVKGGYARTSYLKSGVLKARKR